MLVGELHRNAATERVADHGDTAHVEHGEEVTQPACERTQRVVAEGLGRLTVTQQIRRDDVVLHTQVIDHGVPGLRTAGEPVDEENRLPPGRSGAPEPHRVAVDGDVLEWTTLAHASSIAPRDAVRAFSPI